MTDAIHRKQHDVGATNETGQQRRVVFDAGVMMEKGAAVTLHDRSTLRDLMRASTDIEDTATAKMRRIGNGPLTRREQKADAGLDGGEFLTQGFALALELVTCPLSLGARFDRCRQAFLKPLSTRRLQFEAVIELYNRLA